jgi:hypothetical protein
MGLTFGACRDISAAIQTLDTILLFFAAVVLFFSKFCYCDARCDSDHCIQSRSVCLAWRSETVLPQSTRSVLLRASSSKVLPVLPLMQSCLFSSRSKSYRLYPLSSAHCNIFPVRLTRATAASLSKKTLSSSTWACLPPSLFAPTERHCTTLTATCLPSSCAYYFLFSWCMRGANLWECSTNVRRSGVCSISSTL